MISGIHALIHSPNADTVRKFFRDVLEWRSVDAGGGWLIFALPPAELAVHPTDDEPHTEIYLMCDDLESTMTSLRRRGVDFARPVSEQSWGRVTAIRLPGGGEIGLYQPAHPTALPEKS